MTLENTLSTTITNLSPEAYVGLSNPPLLIDVRSRLEYAQFHAPQAINLSLPRILLGQLPILRNCMLPIWFRTLPKTEAIAMICLTAHRSPMAARTLVKAGFTQVINIEGGMMAWRKAGLQTTTD